jgi:hypothetical protein
MCHWFLLVVNEVNCRNFDGLHLAYRNSEATGAIDVGEGVCEKATLGGHWT